MGPRIQLRVGLVLLISVAASTPLAQATPSGFRLPFFSPRSGKSKPATPPAKSEAPRSEVAPSKAVRELSDWELAHIARVAFWQDTELAPLNLQVSVEQGVATVDGPVPSEYLRKRALALLERLRGIRGVRDQVRVRSSPVVGEPRAKQFPPVDQPWPEHEPPLPSPSAPAAKPSSARLTNRPGAEEAKPPSASTTTWQPASGRGYWLPSNGVRAGLLAPQPQEAKSDCDGPNVRLGAPVVAPQDRHSELARQVDDILQHDPRFSDVRFSIIGRTIYLRGRITSEVDRRELLRALESLTSVEQVQAERLELRGR
jgi:osmotically-inducible protein OsmY